MLAPVEVTIQEKNDDSKSCAQSFLQTPFWARFKNMHGWNYAYYTVTAPIDDVVYKMECSVLYRCFARIFTICYIPLGLELPLNCHISYDSEKYLALLRSFCSELSKVCPKNTLYIRFDPPVSFSSIEKTAQFKSCINVYYPLRSSAVSIQPPDTVILDLFLSEEALLEQMKSKWRYNIRLAEKKGVTIIKGTKADIEVFYSLYKQTARRDGIAIHTKNYYESLFSLAENQDDIIVSLYMAVHEGDILASIITLFTKTRAVYVYGASSNEKRNLMSTYLLQWKAILDAKSCGCLSYDFYGIPPADDEDHPMHGLYRFKTGFGGNIIHRIGSIDYPVSPLYTLYSIAEKARNFWYKKVKKFTVLRT